MPAPAISTRGLTKFYGATRGIEDISLEVRQGEVFGFLGPNGAGKTTFLRTLLDLVRPTRGAATILGFDTRREALEIHRRVGYLAGDLALYENLTGRQLIHWVAAVRGQVDWAEVKRLRTRFRVDLTKRIGDLSKGNRQKVGLLAAMASRPELLVLDEPTSGLDPMMQELFERTLREVKQEGRSVLLSSHVLPEVESVCDRVAIVREGRLIAVESVADLKARAVRNVEVRFAGDVPPDVLAGVPGVSGVMTRGSSVTCTIAGPMDAFVKALARHGVEELLVRQAGLEEIFFALYARGGRSR